MPKLLDFGIARILQPGEGAEPAATMIGLRVMTPEYASPEQMRGEAATTVSDVYSLGVVLYRLLTGRLPFRLASEAPQGMARAIGETEPQETEHGHRRRRRRQRRSGRRNRRRRRPDARGQSRTPASAAERRSGQYRADGIAQGTGAPLPVR